MCEEDSAMHKTIDEDDKFTIASFLESQGKYTSLSLDDIANLAEELI
jgi:hypothetical protein